MQALPDPGEDDGRQISSLVLSKIADSLSWYASGLGTSPGPGHLVIPLPSTDRHHQLAKVLTKADRPLLTDPYRRLTIVNLMPTLAVRPQQRDEVSPAAYRTDGQPGFALFAQLRP